MQRNEYNERDIEQDIYFYNQGTHRQAYHFLGSQRTEVDEEVGYYFTTYAPNAYRVMIQGDFTNWQPIPMELVEGGFWQFYQAGDVKGKHYKYGIEDGNGNVEFKMDPFAFRHEIAPKDASIVWDIPDKTWRDIGWMNRRKQRNIKEQAIQIYEVHPSSWRKHADGTDYTFAQLAESLIPYVTEMGYTHIEFLPLTDHPLDASWGYQTTGYYAVCGRYGTIDELQDFVECAHQANIGVFMDWVPGHFSRNANALAYFDGTPTFEYADVNKANNVGWGTLNFDLAKPQVRSFLIANALFWLKECHLDGLRVDAVSNMIYLDFDQGPWEPNELGTNIKLEGVEFLRQLNDMVHEEVPDALMMAEESTNYPGVTGPTVEDGLGFDYKWNMGWMNDTLKFFEMDPLFRAKNLRLITFAFMYQFNERYILPYSHDEVVHGKNSMLGKVKGDRYNQFATLRVMHGYMMAQPGKKLHFMGNELGQFLEWRFNEELEWVDLSRPYNKEYQHYMKTVNQLGKSHKALHQLDHSSKGIEVLDADNLDEGVLTFIRKGKNPRDFLIIVCNFVPIQRVSVKIGVPYKGTYEVLLNSEMEEFGGKWTHNLPPMKTKEGEVNHQPFYITTIIPSSSVLYIRPKRIYGVMN